MTVKTRQVHLVRRPSETVTPDDFDVVDVTLPDLADGQILVRNLWMSVDPYMRRSMEPVATDMEPWPLNSPLDGPSVGRVIESRNAAFKVGDIVESLSGWQEHFISNGGDFIPFMTSVDTLAVRTATGATPRDYVGLLGVAALTAYAAMVCLARTKPGETVVISSGAGTVGSIACQIGLIQGLRVVTSAGSDEKVDWLKREIGAHEAFNYKTSPMAAALAAACPDGIDLLLENASPEHLSACLPLMNDLRQVLISGFVSIYGTGGKVPPFENFEFVLDRYLTVRGYRFMDSLHAYDQFVDDMLRWRSEGKLHFRETLFEGLEQAPAALCALLRGDVAGKTLVRLGDE